ncbi:hypothetical protein ABZY42_24630 [Streptomyces sp. NPDC006622]
MATTSFTDDAQRDRVSWPSPWTGSAPPVTGGRAIALEGARATR